MAERKRDISLWQKANMELPRTAAERKKDAVESVSEVKNARVDNAGGVTAIEESDIDDPVGPTRAISIHDLFRDDPYMDFVQGCQTDLSGPSKFVWARIMYGDTNWTNYLVRSIDQLKFVLKELTAFYIDNPYASKPVLGVKVHPSITYEFKQLVEGDEEYEPPTKRHKKDDE